MVDAGTDDFQASCYFAYDNPYCHYFTHSNFDIDNYPSRTPSATRTPLPTQTPFVVTVIQTKVITVLAPTFTPSTTATNTATSTPGGPDENETSNQSPLSIAIVGMLATFIGGLVIGILWSTWRKR
jgi:hypothetical protein